MIKPGFKYFSTMESTDYLSNPQEIDISKLSKDHLQAVCEEISTQINRYDYYIRLQLEDTIKNYNLCIALCEEKLDLLSTYKDYKKVLATLSAEKKDPKIIITSQVKTQD